MGKFTIEEIREIMSDPERIRNISVIAHVDHGKTTLTTALIAAAGITSADNVDFMDSETQSKEKGITIKSSGVSLGHELNTKTYLINLIDSPGHVDFSSEVTAALRVTDGAVVVVDAVEGVCVQTETVLRQAMMERIRPVLMINKVDRAILEQKLEAEDIYQQFEKLVYTVNGIIQEVEDPEMGDVSVHPQKGNVAFGAGKDSWGFTIQKFARIYSKKFELDEDKLVQKLWGDVYYDKETKTWIDDSVSKSGQKLKRSFVQFIMEPIIKLTSTIMEGTPEQFEAVLPKLNFTLTSEEKLLKGKHLLRLVLSKWINLPETLLELIIISLPSPKVAQKYRCSFLYEGPQDDACAVAIQNCDSKGPLMVYISKMIPTADPGRYFAFGRVFSGTVYSGQKVRIMGPNYIPGSKEDLALKSIQRTVVIMGKNAESVADVPCGNTVGLGGIDKYLLKTGTISDHEDAHNIRVMRFSVSPVVRVAVEPAKKADLPKLLDGLEKLIKYDSLVQVTKADTGEFIVAGAGELHIEVCLRELEENLASIPIKKSNPIVSYRETISAESEQVCLSKSSNKHNRLFCTAQPLTEDLTAYLENNLSSSHDVGSKAKNLAAKFDWSKDESQGIWAFGPDQIGPNILIDQTTAVQYLQEIKDSVIEGFNWVTREGILCGEAMRKFRVNITDALVHRDNAHRGPGQVVEMARRVVSACQLASKPRIQEPMYAVEVAVSTDYMGGVYDCLNKRRGSVNEEVHKDKIVVIKGFLPVAESFGFEGDLRSLTAGRGFPQCKFDHWQEIEDDPLDKETKVGKLVRSIRKRKGLHEDVPNLNLYHDKL